MKVFKHRLILLSCFVILLGGAGYIFKTKMRFVMFPREESAEVFIKIKAKKGSTRVETAKAIAPLEELFYQDKANVVGVRSTVGQSRRGGEVKENEASILVELIPADERTISLKKLLKKWEDYSKTVPEIKHAKFLKGRWGWSSGSAIELQIQENDDSKRSKIAQTISEEMKKLKVLADVEIEEPLMKKEYLFNIKQTRLIKYNLNPTSVTTALRTFIEGAIVYSINKGEEEVDVRLSVPDNAKKNLNEILNLRIDNKQGRLVYLRNVVDIEEVQKPVNIKRTNFKRSTMVFANMKAGLKITPLEIAERLENEVIPNINNKYPSAILKFTGEIEDSRESQGEFKNSILIVVVLIYLILVVMFNSLTKPFLVLSIVPFGLAGVIYVLQLHGMNVYGFFAVIGALGMIGVVINDAIVMIDKIEKRIGPDTEDPWHIIARVASTRLRPVLVTTITTVVGILPTAYGFAGYDSMLAEMMLTMGWGLAFGTFITLLLIPSLYTFSTKRKTSL